MISTASSQPSTVQKVELHTGAGPHMYFSMPGSGATVNMKTLTPMEARIVRWRFGLDNEDELTLKEIGDKYNLSRERIRQLQEQAIGKIRRQMRDF